MTAVLAEEAAPQQPPVMEKRPMAPVDAGERIDVLDILRGFAIFGILVVNLLFFSQPLFWRMELPENRVDLFTVLFITFFFQGKFYSLFAFLFGLGLSIQLTRATERNADLAPVFKRRLFVLLLIGLVHATLIWYGDILHIYAILGFLLLLFRKRQPKTILIWALLSASIPVVLFFLFGGFLDLMQLSPEGATEIHQAAAAQRVQLRTESVQAIETYQHGDYAEVTLQRLKDLASVDTFAVFFIGHIFALFLLGLYAGKRGILQNIPAHRSFLRKVQIWGLVLGVLGSTASVLAHLRTDPLMPSLESAVYNLFYIIGAPALSFCYATTIIFAAQNPVWMRRLLPLAAVGRMALTNYLLQSILFTTIFYSHGFSLFGRVSPAVGFLVVVAVYLLQVLLSQWWLKRFRFGPMEWLWRSLTYGSRQPMRVVV